MFDNLKNLYQLKKQAEELQKQMSGELISATAGLVTLTLNGNFELVDIKISDQPGLTAAQIEKDTKSAFRQAQEQMKTLLATKFRGMM